MRRTQTLASLVAALMLAGCQAVPDTPLAAAASMGRAEETRMLIAQGVDPNGTDGHGWTPLMWAARDGRLEAIRALIEGGADPNRVDRGRSHWTPLMHAIHRNQQQAVETLLALGADANVKSPGGLTALIMAAGYGYSEMVRVLLARGADPFAEMSNGVIALSAAVSGVPDIDRFTIGSCQTATVRVLLDHAPTLTLKNTFWGRTAPRLAWLGGCSEVLALLDRRAQPLSPRPSVSR